MGYHGIMTTIVGTKSQLRVKNKGVRREMKAQRHQQALTRNLRYFNILIRSDSLCKPDRDGCELYRPSREHVAYLDSVN